MKVVLVRPENIALRSISAWWNTNYGKSFVFHQAEMDRVKCDILRSDPDDLKSTALGFDFHDFSCRPKCCISYQEWVSKLGETPANLPLGLPPVWTDIFEKWQKRHPRSIDGAVLREKEAGVKETAPVLLHRPQESCPHIQKPPSGTWGVDRPGMRFLPDLENIRPYCRHPYCRHPPRAPPMVPTQRQTQSPFPAP